MTLKKFIQKFRQSARKREIRDGRYRTRWGNEVNVGPGGKLIIQQHTYHGIQLLRPICRSNLTVQRSHEGCTVEKEVCFLLGEGLDEAYSVQFALEPEDAAKRIFSMLSKNHSIARICLDCTLGMGCDGKLYFGVCGKSPN